MQAETARLGFEHAAGMRRRQRRAGAESTPAAANGSEGRSTAAPGSDGSRRHARPPPRLRRVAEPACRPFRACGRSPPPRRHSCRPRPSARNVVDQAQGGTSTPSGVGARSSNVPSRSSSNAASGTAANVPAHGEQPVDADVVNRVGQHRHVRRGPHHPAGNAGVSAADPGSPETRSRPPAGPTAHETTAHRDVRASRNVRHRRP